VATILDTPERKRRAAKAFIKDLGFHLILINEDRTTFANCAQCSDKKDNEQYVPHSGVEDCPHPAAICHGYKAGTNDLDHFLELLARRPYAGLGVVNGMSGLVTVDVDTNHKNKPKPAVYANIPGVNDGWDVFASILERYRALKWPDTCLEVRTRNGGGHFTWRVPAGMQITSSSDGRFGWLIDVRGSKGYIPAPGTPVKGGCYQRVSERMNPGPAPEWLMHHLKVTRHFPEPPRQRAPIKPVRLGPHADSRAQGWLQEIADGLSNAPEGTGHAALVVTTCQAAKLVTKGYVTEDDARSALYDAGANRPRDAAGQRGYNSEFNAAWRSALVQVGGAR
jgi:Bifunctional DNA primase/polymerase, N-terminal